MKREHDILVAGGGIAGLSAAAALAQSGFDVLCVDPSPPVTERGAPGADMRTTAILQPGRDTLAAAGLWQALEPHATPLEVMRITDAGAAEREAHVTKDFRARDVSDEPFGWNLPNWLLRREILQRLEDDANVSFCPGIAATDYLGRSAQARVRLSDGSTCEAKLVVAADGRDSPMRRAAGIKATRRRYGQKALAFAVTHDMPHQNVSTEIHETGGPFTLVPLPDFEGRPSSAIVWMDDGPAQTRRLALPVPEFEAELNTRSQYALGPLTLASDRTIWPIISQRAARLTAPRLALIAEAAHVMPPIGAQGLNMSLKDIATLRDLVSGAADPGAPDLLKSYEAKRMPDIRLRIGGIDLLNRASQVKSPLLRSARAQALEALHTLKPLRLNLMQLGLGTR